MYERARHVFDPGLVVGQSGEKGRDESSWDGNRISPLDPSTNPPRPIMSGKIEEKCRKDTRHRYFVPLNQPRPLWECAIFFPSGEHPVWTSTWYFVIPIFGIFTKSILGARDSWEIARFRDFYFTRYTIAI